METYSFLRVMADSWGILGLGIVFLGVCIYAFRPGSNRLQDEAANSIFRNEKRPAAEAPPSYQTEA